MANHEVFVLFLDLSDSDYTIEFEDESMNGAELFLGGVYTTAARCEAAVAELEKGLGFPLKKHASTLPTPVRSKSASAKLATTLYAVSILSPSEDGEGEDGLVWVYDSEDWDDDLNRFEEEQDYPLGGCVDIFEFVLDEVSLVGITGGADGEDEHEHGDDCDHDHHHLN